MTRIRKNALLTVNTGNSGSLSRRAPIPGCGVSGLSLFPIVWTNKLQGEAALSLQGLGNLQGTELFVMLCTSAVSTNSWDHVTGRLYKVAGSPAKSQFARHYRSAAESKSSEPPQWHFVDPRLPRPGRIGWRSARRDNRP
jgi:hypothetical protein